MNRRIYENDENANGDLNDEELEYELNNLPVVSAHDDIQAEDDEYAGHLNQLQQLSHGLVGVGEEWRGAMEYPFLYGSTEYNIARSIPLHIDEDYGTSFITDRRVHMSYNAIETSFTVVPNEEIQDEFENSIFIQNNEARIQNQVSIMERVFSQLLNQLRFLPDSTLVQFSFRNEGENANDFTSSVIKAKNLTPDYLNYLFGIMLRYDNNWLSGAQTLVTLAFFKKDELLAGAPLPIISYENIYYTVNDILKPLRSYIRMPNIDDNLCLLRALLLDEYIQSMSKSAKDITKYMETTEYKNKLNQVIKESGWMNTERNTINIFPYPDKRWVEKACSYLNKGLVIFRFENCGQSNTYGKKVYKGVFECKFNIDESCLLYTSDAADD